MSYNSESDINEQRKCIGCDSTDIEYDCEQCLSEICGLCKYQCDSCGVFMCEFCIRKCVLCDVALCSTCYEPGKELCDSCDVY